MEHSFRYDLHPDIVMTDSQWHTLRAHLLRNPERRWLFWPAAKEQLAFLLASGNMSEYRRRLLVRELLLAGPEDLLRQSHSSIAPKSAFVMDALNRCREEGLHLIEVHSHPFSRGAGTTFSSIDWNNDLGKMPALAALLDDFMHVTMVVGRDSLDSHFYDRLSGEILPIRQVTLVSDSSEFKNGHAGLHYIPTTNAINMERETSPETATSGTEEQYARQELIFGRSTQQQLGRSTVAVVGLGGLGSFVALELAHLGVGSLILIDPDRVEVTNLNRLLGAEPAHVGLAKVDAYKQLIERIAPTVHVEALPLSILDEAALTYAKGADILVGCVDSHGARMILNQLAVRYLIPLVDGGSGIKRLTDSSPLKAGGQVQVVLPNLGCLECRGFIDARRAAFDLASPERQAEERAHGYGLHTPAPAVIFLNGVIGSLQVGEVVSLLTGLGVQTPRPVPPIGLYDAFERSLLAVDPQASPECLTCGEEGVTGIGDLAPIRRATDAESGTPIPLVRSSEPSEDISEAVLSISSVNGQGEEKHARTAETVQPGPGAAVVAGDDGTVSLPGRNGSFWSFLGGLPQRFRLALRRGHSQEGNNED